jgi:hypothetical protein
MHRVERWGVHATQRSDGGAADVFDRRFHSIGIEQSAVLSQVNDTGGTDRVRKDKFEHGTHMEFAGMGESGDL